ncbi:DUF3017 domain-containing protein [Thalassiella azotivora]
MATDGPRTPGPGDAGSPGPGEPGGEDRPQRTTPAVDPAPDWLGPAVLAAVTTAVVGAVLVALVLDFRLAAYWLASVLVVVAVVRAVLPVALVGPLAVRSRALDVAVAAVTATGLVVVAEGIPL